MAVVKIITRRMATGVNRGSGRPPKYNDKTKAQARAEIVAKHARRMDGGSRQSD